MDMKKQKQRMNDVCNNSRTVEEIESGLTR